MGSAKDGIKAPPPQTVLSGHTEGNGAEQASATARAMRRQRDTKAFRERLRRIEDGVMALDELEPVDAGILVSGATMLNRQQSHNYVKRIFEHSPIARSIVREIDNVASINTDGYEDYRTKRRFFDKPYAYISDLRAQGAALRKATGFGVSLPKNHSVNLLDQSGRIVVTLPRGTAAALAVDARFQPGLQLLQQAHRGEAPADLAAVVNAAVEAAGEGRKIGDAWLFKSDEDRAAAIQSAFTAIQQKKPGDPGRQQAFQVLALSLLAEALPHKQAHQLLMDMVPGLGNARAAEDARRSGEAAIEAFERGDEMAGLAHLAETTLNVFGAVLGPITFGTAASSKTVRATVQRNLNDLKTRYAELRTAIKTNREHAAVKRTETYVRRTIGKQFDVETSKARDRYLSAFPKQLAGKVKHQLMLAIGDAGEFYFEPIFQRIHPKMMSQAQVTRLRAAGRADEADAMDAAITKIRNEKEIRPEEWKQFLAEALDYRLGSMRDALEAAGSSPSATRDGLMKVLEVADLNRIFTMALLENAAGASARATPPKSQ